MNRTLFCVVALLVLGIALVGSKLFFFPVESGEASHPGKDPGAVTVPGEQLVKEQTPTPTSLVERYHDGASWKDAIWAADEMQVLLEPGTDVAKLFPLESIFVRQESEFGIRVKSMDRPGFVVRAKELRLTPGVREVRPVYYATQGALERRSIKERLILTRTIAVSLPEGVEPAALAGRYGARVVSQMNYMPRTWLLEVVGPFDALEVASALRDKEALSFAAPQFASVAYAKRTLGKRRLIPDDPLFPSQWHLRNTGQNGGTAGEDINVVLAWDVVQGTGVVIGVVDDGMEHTHPDLLPNYSASLSWDFNGNDPDPMPGTDNNHGTACAGLAGARGNNAIGVSGSAPRAILAGLRLLGAGTTDAQDADALSYRNDAIHVKSNSWSLDPDNGASLGTIGPLTLAAIANGVTTGRGGRGVVYTWAAGNGRTAPDYVNFDGLANRRSVIGVGSVSKSGRQAWYSESGDCLMVCAPGGESDTTTTDRVGAAGYASEDYASDFSGTSASTPIVSGVTALMLERNPTLSARDVMHILARSARRNDPTDSGWILNAGGFYFNYKYGFGVVNALGAVTLAGAWPYVGAEAAPVSAASATLNMAIPDNTLGGVTNTLTIPATPTLRIEHVEVDFTAAHSFRGDLRVTLTGPSGTASVLADLRPNDSCTSFSGWTFMSRRFWNETTGTGNGWTIRVEDLDLAATGTFTGWTLRIYGTPVDVTLPVAGTVNDGVGADIALQTSTTTMSANWSGFSDPQSGIVYEWAIGTAPGLTNVAPFTSVGYASSASRSDLVLVVGTTYYVTVRATNFGLLTTSVSSLSLIHI